MAPFAANRFAIAWPMPLPPPVITAVLFFSWKSMGSGRLEVMCGDFARRVSFTPSGLRIPVLHHLRACAVGCSLSPLRGLDTRDGREVFPHGHTPSLHGADAIGLTGAAFLAGTDVVAVASAIGRH